MGTKARWTAAIASAVLVLAGCAGGGGTGASEDICDGAEGNGPKIGLAYDVGGRGDQSFNDSAYAGLEKAVDELDATCIEAEANAGESDQDRAERLRQLADNGYNPIIAVGFVYSPATYQVAPEYPDVNFGIIDGYTASENGKDLPNVANINFAANEGSFLVGVAAALTTKTDNVGFLGGLNSPLIQEFEAGFNAGVQAVDPNIEVQSQYLSQDDPVKGFENRAGGKTAATGMYENGADVIYHAAGKSGLGLFDAAVQAGEGKWAIGVDADQYVAASQDHKPHILTSMLKRVDTGVFKYAEAVDQGNPPSGYITYDLEDGGVGYSTSGDHLSEDAINQIEDYKQQIINGEIKVPTEP